MKKIRSTHARGFEVVLSDGTALFLPRYGTLSVTDEQADDPHVQEHRDAGRCVVEQETTAAPPAEPATSAQETRKPGTTTSRRGKETD
jgi:hypothetical protein